MEAPKRFNPETGKPNPVSVKEFFTMDRKEQRSFFAPLSESEKFDFQARALAEYGALPLAEKKSIAEVLVKKLEQRKNTSVGDRLELARARFEVARFSIPPKEPIFLRKLRMADARYPKWMKTKKSPYLIAS